MHTNSLWGDLDLEVEVRTPAQILQEQAVALAELTNGVLLGRVHTRNHRGKLITDLEVVAPLLDNYTYTLVEVEHSVELYPLVLRNIVEDDEIQCLYEDDFVQELGNLLSSDEVKRIIQSLVSQSRAIG